MARETTMYLVKNRSAGRVAYQIPDIGVKRHFAPGEVQKISYGELEKLSWQPGGKQLMANFLQIQAEEALRDLSVSVEPEYYMSEQQIKELLESGSFEAFLDCLDFAPTGVLDLIKDYAVKLPLSDYKKREALRDKLGFDVDKALANKKAEEEEAKNPGGFVADGSKTTTTATTTRPAARRTTANYKTEAAK